MIPSLLADPSLYATLDTFTILKIHCCTDIGKMERLCLWQAFSYLGLKPDSADFFRSGIRSSVSKKCPKWFVANVSSKPSSVDFLSSLPPIPALLTKMSIFSRDSSSLSAQLLTDFMELNSHSSTRRGPLPRLPVDKIWSLPFLGLHQGGGRGRNPRKVRDQILQRSVVEL